MIRALVLKGTQMHSCVTSLMCVAMSCEDQPTVRAGFPAFFRFSKKLVSAGNLFDWCVLVAAQCLFFTSSL